MCHWRSRSGNWTGVEDLEDTDGSCEAGCYKCVLSYYNQPEHKHLDRKDPKVLDLLCRLARSVGRIGSAGRTAEQQFDELMRLSTSSLEQDWLRYVRDHGYRLPDAAQHLIKDHGTRCDFYYSDHQAPVYLDGPHHEAADRRRLDAELTANLEDAGYTVVRFNTDVGRVAGCVQPLWLHLRPTPQTVHGRGEE